LIVIRFVGILFILQSLNSLIVIHYHLQLKLLILHHSRILTIYAEEIS